jgi:hypothetical protein
MAEPRVPEVRDDDAEEVADKLSIAAAMWARGDRADALSWLRRAAESASDAEQDMRALELAKAASELSTMVDSPSNAAQVAAPAAPAAEVAQQAPPRKPPTAPPPKPSAAPGRAPAAASTLPKKPPGGKLPPLPPLRPLGSAPPAPKPQAPAPKPEQRVQSMITSALGPSSTSGTVAREHPAEEPPKPMPWDEPPRAPEPDDDEATHQIAVPDDPVPADPDTTATREIAVMASQPAREEPPPISTNEEEPPASQAELALAIGVRVRLVQDDHGVHVYPEGQRTDGVLAILVPIDGNDDLRSVFQRRP